MAQEADVPRGLWGKIEKLIDDKISQFARSGFLRNASISGGAGLTIKDGGRFRANYPIELGGGEMLYVGDIYSVADGSYQGTGLLLQRPDGGDMMVMRTDSQFGTTMQNIYDSGGRIIFGNDAATGQGLARPYLSGAFHVSRVQDFPKTTNGAFETVWRAHLSKQHPRLYVSAWGSTDTAGTTGEVRVMVNGVQLGATQAATNGVVTGYGFGPAGVAGAFGDMLSIEIQARRTAGTGSVQAGAAWVEGRQS